MPITPDPLKFVEAVAWVAGRVVARPLGGGSLFRVWIPGDSRGTGYNGGDTAAGHGVQYHLARALRSRRGDVCFVGSTLYTDYGSAGLNNAIGSVSPGEYAPMDWEHEGHSGYTMAQVQAGLSGWLTTIATTPDVVVLGLGANTDGHAAAAIAATDLPALVAATRALLPSSWIIIETVPPQGTPAATMAAYNALIIAHAAAGTGVFADSRVIFCDTCSDFTLAEQGPDGSVHESQFGYAKRALRLAAAIESVLPLRAGPVWPRPKRPRVFARKQGLQFAAATDVATGANAGCDIGSDSFAIDVEVTPLSTQLPRAVGSATYKHILTAGSVYATGLTLTANGDSLSIYLGSGGPKLQDVPGVFGKPGVPVRILIHGDRSSGTLSIWVDGTLRSIATGIAAWSFATGNNLVIGYNAGIGQDAFPCIVRDLRFHRAASGMPLYAPGTLRLHAEASAADGVPLSGTSAWFKCDDTPTTAVAVDALGGTSLTLTGARYVYAPEPSSLPEPSGSIEIVDSIAPTGRDMIGALCTLDLDAALGVTLTSSKVSNWQDNSGGAHSFLQATAGNRPTVTEDGINGRPAVVFTSAGTSKLTCADAMSTIIQAGSWHAFIVAQYDSLAANNTPAIYGNHSLLAESSSRWGISARTGAGTPKLGAWKVHAGPVYDYTPEITIATGIPYVIEFSFDGTTITLRTSGGVLGTTVQTAQNTTAATVVDALTGTWILGADYSGTSYANAQIARVIVSKQALQTATATRVRNALRRFYRI